MPAPQLTIAGAESEVVEPRRRPRRDATAVCVSAVCHGLFLVLAAVLYIGVGFGTEPTLITSTWTDGPPQEAVTQEVVELVPNDSGGVKGQPDPGQVIKSAGIFAATDSGLNVDVGTGFGGAFFGAGGGNAGVAGKRIVYIVDASGSMQEHLIRITRFQRVQRELETSILSLDKRQQFAIILFNLHSRSVGAKSLRYATDAVKSRTIAKVWDSAAGGGTDPRGAINKALRLRPDTIYFLTDGVFPPASVEELLKRRYDLTVHTFTLGDASGEAIMRRVAEANRGTYRFVDGKPTTGTDPAEQTATTTTAGTPNASNIPPQPM